jgi:hypothetical protein
MPSKPLRVVSVDDNRAVLATVGRISDQQVDMALIGVASGVDAGGALVAAGCRRP